jgi:hypothetical protein
MADEAQQREWLRCAVSAAYFTHGHVQIYNATAQQWMPFVLWSAQMNVLEQMEHERLLVVLKARQLGLSWLTLAYALWLLVFRAPATVLLFSLREAEAVELLGRLRGMAKRLPDWMVAWPAVRENDTRWELHNGSRALAFSTNGGRSYTATMAVVDEADFVPDLGQFLNGVKPTVDAGGKLFLISTSDKRSPVSVFKQLYRAALQGVGDYRAVFLPWSARPDRDAAWHARTKAEMYAQRGTDDDFYAEYPATADEALAPEQLDRRLPLEWLRLCFAGEAATAATGAPSVTGLTVWRLPVAGARYVIGVDPAEGNVHSDESVACVMDAVRWEQVAVLAARVEPGLFARMVAQVAGWYNAADVLVERNNHGHALLLALADDGTVKLVDGYDGRPGWLSNVKGKPLLYDTLAEAVRDQAVLLHDQTTLAQLASIEASTLRAPTGLHDDRADACALAVAALAFGNRGEASVAVAPVDPLAGFDREGW